MCHAESQLNRIAIARWLASFTNLAGIVVIKEGQDAKWRRVRNEVRRIGRIRFLDVLAFRAYYTAFMARKDNAWLRQSMGELGDRFPEPTPVPEILTTGDPNSHDTEVFVRRLKPDMMIARCKRILNESIFAIPRMGTFILHPGICPEYRNAHGAFWALAMGDLSNVGLTLLRIDRGVDTGPVFGRYSYPFDEVTESHIRIMTRLALENLDPIRDRLLAIHSGLVSPTDTQGRPSGIWGQPWLTSYLKWKRDARRRRDARSGT